MTFHKNKSKVTKTLKLAYFTFENRYKFFASCDLDPRPKVISRIEKTSKRTLHQGSRAI